MAGLVNANHRTLLPWTILQVSEPGYTFTDFFDVSVLPRIPGRSTTTYVVNSVYVGPGKNSLDAVDVSLCVLPVISSFGRFVKYCVVTAGDNDNDNGMELTSHPRDAFEVLMNSARIYRRSQLSGDCSEFVKLINQHNKKDKLFNDIVQFLKSKNLSLKSSEVDTEGVKLVYLLRDIFWHIDGHHHVFQQRSVAIPDVFSPFCNYNVPELSKHRKRRTINLSGHLIQQFVLDLCTMLHANIIMGGVCFMKLLSAL